VRLVGDSAVTLPRRRLGVFPSIVALPDVRHRVIAAAAAALGHRAEVPTGGPLGDANDMNLGISEALQSRIKFALGGGAQCGHGGAAGLVTVGMAAAIARQGR
jgi:hypothetical protein